MTHRQLQCLQMIAQGLTNQQAARRLFLSEETVKTYVRGALRDLGARNRAHAVALAMSSGLLPYLGTAAPQASPQSRSADSDAPPAL